MDGYYHLNASGGPRGGVPNPNCEPQSPPPTQLDYPLFLKSERLLAHLSPSLQAESESDETEMGLRHERCLLMAKLASLGPQGQAQGGPTVYSALLTALERELTSLEQVAEGYDLLKCRMHLQRAEFLSLEQHAMVDMLMAAVREKDAKAERRRFERLSWLQLDVDLLQKLLTQFEACPAQLRGLLPADVFQHALQSLEQGARQRVERQRCEMEFQKRCIELLLETDVAALSSRATRPAAALAATAAATHHCGRQLSSVTLWSIFCFIIPPLDVSAFASTPQLCRS